MADLTPSQSPLTALQILARLGASPKEAAILARVLTDAVGASAGGRIATAASPADLVPTLQSAPTAAERQFRSLFMR